MHGFFVGWANPLSPETHLQLLQASYEFVLAYDTEKSRVVGFITAISDGLLSAYLPLLEVLSEYQKQGIGTTLVQRMLSKLGNLYRIDIVCDPRIEKYYRRFGFKQLSGMSLRNYKSLDGV